MTSTQRKAHLYIWVFLIIVIPIAIVFSIKNRPTTDSVNAKKEMLLQQSERVEVRSFQNELIEGSISKQSLNIFLKNPLKVASSVIYTIDANGNKLQALGQVSIIGNYSFLVEYLPHGIVIFDPVKNTEITKILFKWD